ncbi:ArsR/SmtB family transcription factor [Streptomyces sp. NPDC058289]|uniref:ArsR/SmtB family transcription factor n=1 Tax=Streptomyces sp. NPDC058289 TaxID=3346425 RepID=UPI0036E9C6C2
MAGELEGQSREVDGEGEQCADQLRALARESPCSVGEPAEALDLGQPTVSNHLRLLRHLDLVTGRRDGRSVIYELHDAHVAALLRQILAHVHHDRP